MAYVVPHISSSFVIRRESQSSLETADGHVVLLGVETAQTEVSEEFCVIHTHLKEPSVGRRGERGGGVRGCGGD